ncbi:hypothetical protein LCGC14_0365570 [marine sediment metagenome]|uniref:Com family DNA-binding transcriptional regulator n=1 Tax=marine sediment metagenome TaxID=412755 RepID=A0A0F9VTX8_9ZZZZ
MADVRCKKCNKKLGAELDGQINIVCPKCSTYNTFDTRLDKLPRIVVSVK